MQTRFLGAGTYAQVYEAIDTVKSQKVALKKSMLKKSEGIPATSLREISILKTLKHPNVVQLLNVMHTEESLILIFEYLDFDLKGYITNCRPRIVDLTIQLLKGIKYMHERKIIHRDLKPQNILVTSTGQLKIADFGLARSMDIKMPSYSPEVVTLWYRCPELLVGQKIYNSYVDMWSVGCIIFEIICNRPLFVGKDVQNQIEIIMKMNDIGMGRCLWERLGNIPGYLVEIILGCVSLNYETRFSAERCLSILEEVINNTPIASGIHK